MEYRYCGKSGLQLPVVSLGLWHNFGETDDYENSRNMICYAFDNGITHFDLANNYGPPPGSAEVTFGKVLSNNLATHRDEMIISSKAGHLMWNGPYGDGGSRKHIMASINQSLKRTKLEYFDIFYSHRYDPQTPIEETMMALVDIVRQGKALYIGLSKYPHQKAKEAFTILKENNVPCLIYQDRYNMLTRNIENELLPLIENYSSGFISFSPLAQGLLTNKYLKGIPQDSRAAQENSFLKKEIITDDLLTKIKNLEQIAENRQQSLAQMSLAWTLRQPSMTSAIVGVRNTSQLDDNLKAVRNLNFTISELEQIDQILNS